MKLIDKDALVAEIERRIKNLYPKVGQGMVITKILKDHYEDFLSFIDTLEVKDVEEEPVSEELDAASIAYAEAFIRDVNILEIQQAKWHERHPEEPVIQGGIKACFIFMRNAFLDGAKWQETKNEKTLRDFFNARNQGDASFKDLLAFKEGVETGRKEMKEQMMARAIDGDITFDYYGDGDKTYGCIAHNSFCLEDFGLKDRDKVKIIVVKED